MQHAIKVEAHSDWGLRTLGGAEGPILENEPKAAEIDRSKSNMPQTGGGLLEQVQIQGTRGSALPER